MAGPVTFGAEEATETLSRACLLPEEGPAGEPAGPAAPQPQELPPQQAAALAGQQRQLSALLQDLDEAVKRMSGASSEEGGTGSAAARSPRAAAAAAVGAAPLPPAATPPPAAYMRQQLGLLQGLAEDLSSQAAAATALVGRQAELLVHERTARERAEAAAAAASEERRQGDRQRQRLQHYLAELQVRASLRQEGGAGSPPAPAATVAAADELRDRRQRCVVAQRAGGPRLAPSPHLARTCPFPFFIGPVPACSVRGRQLAGYVPAADGGRQSRAAHARGRAVGPADGGRGPRQRW